MKILVRIITLCIAVTASYTGAQENLQPRRLVDMHTAGVLPRGHYDLECRFYAAGDRDYESGMMTGVSVGLTDRFTVGLSYGGEGIIGRRSDVNWNDQPGVLIKYRLFEERYVTPALAVGYDHQGLGGTAGAYEFGYDGYIFKSPGFFAALSKNYIMLSIVQIGLHGTSNYSLEDRKNVNWPNFMTGFDITINEELAFVMEYDFALNDRTGKKWKYHSPGFLNAGLRWAFSPNFHLEFDVKDIFENKMRRIGDNMDTGEPVPVRVKNGWSRELKVLYYSQF
ncbi:MAG: YjbH domain-containing protein [Chitinispirillales bacterium]|nr:YjbH domain-containing protein [Chitinispirillales bacterium]